VARATLARLASLARPVELATRGWWVPLAHLEEMEVLVILGPLVHQDLPDQRELMDWMEKLVILVQVELLERLAVSCVS